MTTPDTPTPSSGPLCAACGENAVVNWGRRLTQDEVADLVTGERERRAQLLLLADPQLPPPAFGPLPTGDGMTRTIYACAPHAITLEAAALIHQNTCTAPNPASLPGCDCTPETPKPAPPDDETAPFQLPEHWLPAGG